MDSVEPSAAIYSEAKSEYTRQLICNFQPVLLRFFLDRYQETKASVKTKSALSEFQDSLSQIPEWNIDKVQKETSKLLGSINCDYVEDLITAVFIAHTKILSAIRLQAKPRRRINITVPKPEHFMHRALSECSRLLWANVYLFGEQGSSLDRQKNMNEANKFLEEGILQAIRNLLPVKSILRDSLQEDDDDGVHVSNAPEETPSGETPAVEHSEPEAQPTADAPLLAPPTEAFTAEEAKETADVVKEIRPATEQSSVVTKLPEEAELKPIMDLSGVELFTQTPAPSVPVVPEATVAPSQTFVVDTEKSVAFAGMNTVFGDGGVAELQPLIDEGDDNLKILDEVGELGMDEFEDLDKPEAPPAPLSADDFETL